MYVAEKTHICNLSAKTSTSFIFFANGEVQQCRGQLRAQGVGNALYGLRSLGDSKEVRQLVAALTEKVLQCTEPLGAQAMSNALYGLQKLGDSEEARRLVAALT